MGVMAEYARRTGLPIPVSPRVIYRWADGLGIPASGEAAIFTGALYQLTPYIDRAVELLSRLSFMGGWALRAAGLGARARGLAGLLLRPSSARVRESEEILRSIYGLLVASGVSPSYQPGADWYSGVLLYDLGLEEEFSELARRVYGRLRASGVRRAITVDPHTTYVLRVVYPRYIDGYDLEVVNYLELVDESAVAGAGGGRVAVHDPCYYARFLGISEAPRRLLRAAGYEVVEPRGSGRGTHCCGGPVEGLSPELARKVAERRASELAEAAGVAVTMCPICLSNLSRARRPDLRLLDISLALRPASSK